MGKYLDETFSHNDNIFFRCVCPSSCRENLPREYHPRGCVVCYLVLRVYTAVSTDCCKYLVSRTRTAVVRYCIIQAPARRSRRQANSTDNPSFGRDPAPSQTQQIYIYDLLEQSPPPLLLPTKYHTCSAKHPLLAQTRASIGNSTTWSTRQTVMMKYVGDLKKTRSASAVLSPRSSSLPPAARGRLAPPLLIIPLSLQPHHGR